MWRMGGHSQDSKLHIAGAKWIFFHPLAFVILTAKISQQHTTSRLLSTSVAAQSVARKGDFCEDFRCFASLVIWLWIGAVVQMEHPCREVLHRSALLFSFVFVCFHLFSTCHATFLRTASNASFEQTCNLRSGRHLPHHLAALLQKKTKSTIRLLNFNINE